MSPPRWPRSLKSIVGNEACERFSYYGMRAVLTVFLVDRLLQAQPPETRAASAKEIFHLFSMGVYFFPLFGGYLADRYWGKYKTILRLSLVYCAGHACLALFDDSPPGFYAGLALIAVGSGGIKPCVSAFAGDQLTADNRALAPKVFAAFYWAINLGSLFASASTPKLLVYIGPEAAFGLPGVLMLLATLIFWLGRKSYAHVPPSGPNPHGFFAVIASAARAPVQPGVAFLDRTAHPPAAVEGTRAVLRLLKIFAFVPFFWMLFDQKASAWVLQARRMELDIGPWRFEPSQLQFINPLLVLILIPLCSGVIYPALERWGLTPTPLRRMTAGMFFAGLSFVMVAAIEAALDRGTRVWVLWQLAPYIALTIGEVLFSVTGLEFAYAQAPPAMKGVVQSLWYVAVAAGNFVVALVARVNVFSGAGSFLFYAAAVTLAGIGLALVARRHVTREFFRAA